MRVKLLSFYIKIASHSTQEVGTIAQHIPLVGHFGGTTALAKFDIS